MDTIGRILKVDIYINDKNVSIFSIYAPNNDKERIAFFNDISTYINPNRLNIICGDFNDIVNPYLDRAKGMYTNKHSCAAFKSFINNNNLCDIYRHKHPDQVQFTRRAVNNNKPRMSRIDYILVSRQVKSNVVNVYITHTKLSDHSQVILTVDLSECERGPGVYIFNNTLLNDIVFCEKINNIIINESKLDLFNSEPLVWWDNLKYKIKSTARIYSKHIKKKQRELYWDVQNKLTKEYARLERTNSTNFDTMIELETKLEHIENDLCKGAILRSKVQHAVDSDRNTSYFLSLEKQRQNNKCIKELINDNGDILNDTSSILYECSSFYSNLYAKDEDNLSAINDLSKVINNTILPIDREFCDKSITLDELSTTLKSLTKNKSPGLDSLPPELYLKFWDTLGPLYQHVINYIYANGIMSRSMRKGMLTLIFKEKGDRRNLKNYRPISLLNTDYKILSKCLSTRLRKVIHTIISPEQTCSIPGRNILHTVASIRDLIDYTDDEDIEGFILKLDAEKAFDRVSHIYLFHVLKCFGFGDSFIKWIKILYSDISSTVKCNGHLSPFFKVGRSVRQGCPLSAILYVITAEPLNLLIKQSPLKGIPIKDSNIVSLIYQHADDTNLTLANIESVNSVFKVLELYVRGSGALINKSKSELLPIGKSEYLDYAYNIDVKIVSDAIEILGVYLGPNRKVCSSLNWDSKVSKIKQLLGLWSRRRITLAGKVTVIQSLLLSKLWYTASVIPLPDAVEREITSLVNKFLWRGKPPRVKHTTLVKTKADGGLNLPNIKLKCQSLCLKWITKFCDINYNHVWKSIMTYYLSKGTYFKNCMNILKLNLDKNILSNLPEFYKYILHAWDDLNKHTRPEPRNIKDVSIQPIFNNSRIRHNGRMLDFKLFQSPSIKYIYDIVYYVKPGFIPFHSVKDIINDDTDIYDNDKILKNYELIKSSIPESWKNIIENQCYDSTCSTSDEVVFILNDASVKSNALTSKFCYKLLLKNYVSDPASYSYWKENNINVNWPVVWKSVFKNYKNPINIDLDFKIAHNIVWTKEKLYKVKIVDNNLCPVCKIYIEDIVHMFIDCSCLSNLIALLKEIINDILKYKINDDDFKSGLLLGMQSTIVAAQVELSDVVLSAARQAIYKRRMFMLDNLNSRLNIILLFKHILKNNLYHISKYFKNIKTFIDKFIKPSFLIVYEDNGDIQLDF
ncbi:hypothetical protein SNE40_021121 [Patella caerulea]|uniref:Reverse transcriptase domain-containing protein n=1 Tax=Patella caerulea TaxID=87958 RepID=A0AAN8G7H5_PATCE